MMKRINGITVLYNNPSRLSQVQTSRESFVHPSSCTSCLLPTCPSVLPAISAQGYTVVANVPVHPERPCLSICVCMYKCVRPAIQSINHAIEAPVPSLAKCAR